MHKEVNVMYSYSGESYVQLFRRRRVKSPGTCHIRTCGTPRVSLGTQLIFLLRAGPHGVNDLCDLSHHMI